MRFSRTLLSSGFILLASILAACSGTSSYGSGNPAPTTAPTTSTSPSSNNYGKDYSTPAAKGTTTTNSAGVAIKTATATVNGKTATILTNSQGLTLYYFTPDTPTTAACTTGCVDTWPPLLATGSQTPTSAATLPGKLTALADTNGTQVQYNGHFLYTYVGDTAAGQTNGEGIGGKWFVATTNLT